jgi:prolipoprotein diacylglyceryltransferase
MQQVIWRIPGVGLPIYGFGLMLFFAFLITTWIAIRRGRQVGIGPDTIQDLTIWAFLGGLLGARIAYVLQLDPPTSVGDFFWKLPQIWNGGIILYGAVAGGLLACLLAHFFVFRKRGATALKLADVVAPSIAIGLCLGRLGCFLNGCCYGQVACPDCPVYAVHFPMSAPSRYTLTDEGYQTPAGFTIVDQIGHDGVLVDKVAPGSAADQAGLRQGDQIVAVNDQSIVGDAVKNEFVSSNQKMASLLGSNQWPRGQKTLKLTLRDAKGDERSLTFEPRTLGLHPTQLYESISMFLLFLVLAAFWPFRTRDGQVMALLMMCYAVHRYLNELLRDDPRPVGFEQYSSYLLFALGLAMMLWLWQRPAQYKVAWAAT